MILTAELPLVISAIALALVALSIRARPSGRAIGLVAVAIGTAAPLVLFATGEAPSSGDRALWEWSAVGGPTIQASYRFDGLAAIGVALTVLYASAGLFAASRITERRPLLPALILANALVSIALHVTTDLVAATVVLGGVAALTALMMLLVAPPPATARFAAFVAIGLQSFVVASLLISRFGGASFRYDDIRPDWISAGVIVSASLGAALFAGLYPFVPWRFERGAAEAAEREPLRGLLAMPAGVGASLVLLRLLGTTRGDVTDIALPTTSVALRLIALVAVALVIAALAAVRRGLPRRALASGGVILVAIVLYPALHWSQVVLLSVLLTVLYAAAVSLAVPDEWDVVRHDVALAGLWAGIAVGTPLAIAAGLTLALAEGASSLVDTLWMPPHRAQIVVGAAGATFVAASLALIGGVGMSTDPVAAAIGVVALGALLALELVHIGRRLSLASVPIDLDVTASLAAVLSVVLVAILAAIPVDDALASLARPFAHGSGAAVPLAAITLAVTATLLVLLARSLRPLVPDLRPAAASLRVVVAAADPVPGAMGAFHALEAAATGSNALFTLFERRAGVWLATLLIIALLVWATGS